MREVQVDLDAIVSNYNTLKSQFAPAQVMAVVKANAYGHGAIEVAKALQKNGADFLGVADLDEALALREAGIDLPILAWIMQPDHKMEEAVKQNIQLGISNFPVLNKALELGATIHAKVDTGLGRGGFARSQWVELFSVLQTQKIAGVFSHLANTTVFEDIRQQRYFEMALKTAENYYVEVGMRHLAASAGAMTHPGMRYDMVRCGIALYGLNPDERDMSQSGLVPAMRATSQLINCKRVPAGQTVSYNYRYRAKKATYLGLVPFGYAEGMPRLSKKHKVLIDGELVPVVGQVAMDQFVVELGDKKLPIGTEVVIFGDPAKGEPSAEQLGASASTINYDVVTGIGGRANRVWTGGDL